MASDLAYDMILEVEGLIRSLSVRTSLDHELQVGETFTLHGRNWVVERVDAVSSKGIDRRLVAREVAAEAPVAA